MNNQALPGPRRWAARIAAALIGVCALPAQAVIIYGGSGVDAPANDTAPAGFEDAWARVGQSSNGTLVYLGNGYVLTAAHVFIGSTLSFDGVVYDAVGTNTVLKNPDDSEADLRLFRIAVPSGSPLHGMDVLEILDSSIATSSNPEDGILIGTGIGQTTAQPISLAPEGGPSGNGFVWGTSRDKRWGVAEIGTPNAVPEIFGRTVQEGFKSTFRFNSGADSIAANNDSGSPLFYDDNGTVKLAGLVHAVTRLNYARQNDDTFLSDLAEFNDQINVTLGDLDGDGSVGEGDLGLILGNFGDSVQAGNWFQGDADGDGIVGINDLDYVLSKWGDGPVPALSSIAIPVPEPTSLLMVGGALVMLASRRRRN